MTNMLIAVGDECIRVGRLADALLLKDVLPDIAGLEAVKIVSKQVAETVSRISKMSK